MAFSNTAQRVQLPESPFFPETRNSLPHHEAKHLMLLKHTVLSLEGHVGSWALVRKLLNKRLSAFEMVRDSKVEAWGQMLQTKTLFLTPCFKRA